MALFPFGRKQAPASPPPLDLTTPEPAASELALQTPVQPTVEKKGLLDRLRAGLAKTAQVLNTDVRDLLKREGRLVDEPFLEELRATLVRTDMLLAFTIFLAGYAVWELQKFRRECAGESVDLRNAVADLYYGANGARLGAAVKARDLRLQDANDLV